MQIPVVVLAAALTLAGCGAHQPRTASLEPRTSSSIRLYGDVLPRCPYREVGYVTGRSVRDLRVAAFGLRANAVLLEPSEGRRTGPVPYAGTTIQFLDANCRR